MTAPTIERQAVSAGRWCRAGRSTPAIAPVCAMMAVLSGCGIPFDVPPPQNAVDAATGFPFAFRTIDGTYNNTQHPEWGSADTTFLRMASVDYADGIGEPAGANRPSARVISNACAAQSVLVPNNKGASDYLWQWGQFLDHDMAETPVADPAEPFDILVPLGDPMFDPSGTGLVTIPLDRSVYSLASGVRQQLNAITAFIDASNVYGSDAVRANALRTLDGTGRLATSSGDLLPFNVLGLDNAPNNSASFFVAGDVRANEQVGLTAMHTLFVREHNAWADAIRAARPELTGDEVYEICRAIVAAEVQAITYQEFLPILLGVDALPAYDGYDGDVNPGIANEFATAAYRLGHSMLSPMLMRRNADGNPIEAGDLALAQAFFDPTEIINNGIDCVLRGLAMQDAQEIDNRIVDDVRNFLFGEPGAGGFDLASLNIQRGRDHGLPSLNQLRVDLGLPRYDSFTDISPDENVQNGLAGVYASVDDIDAWVGGLAEPHVPDTMIGETFYTILVDQFTRLRDGDRFFYKNYLPSAMIDMIEKQKLSRIICRNTNIGSEMQANVFLVTDGAPANQSPPAIQPDEITAVVSAVDAWLEARSEP